MDSPVGPGPTLMGRQTSLAFVRGPRIWNSNVTMLELEVTMLELEVTMLDQSPPRVP